MDGKDFTPELDSLDTLEKDFQSVIGSLVGDRSLDSFRAEYERIHDLYIESHNKNEQLVEECKKLNMEILSNSTKVNSILKLSQDDQRTISSLRYEFEKAWKMVELSQDREARCGDIIESLKAQVNQLNRVVETSGTAMYTQDNSLESIRAEIEVIKKEMEVQQTQIQQLQEDLLRSTDERESIAFQAKNMQELVTRIEGDISNAKTDLQKIIDENKEIQNSITEVKLQHKDETNRQDQIKSDKKESRSRIEELTHTYQIESQTVKSMLEESRDIQSRLDLANGLLESRKEATAKLTSHVSQLNEEIVNKNETINQLKSDISSIDATFSITEKELSEEKAKRVQVQKDLSEVRKLLEHHRQESLLRTIDVNKIVSNIHGLQHQIQLFQQRILKDENEEGVERGKVINIEGQQESINGQMMALKGQVHQMRIKMSQLIQETEHYKDESSTIRSVLASVVAEDKARLSAIKPLKKELSDINEKIKKQETQSESMQQQRDLIKRQWEQWQKETNTLSNDAKYAAQELQSIKEQIREKDADCIETHLNKEELLDQNSNLLIQQEALIQKSKEATARQNEIENCLVRTRFLCENGEDAVDTQRRINEDLAQKVHGLSVRVQNKTYERNTLMEKVRIVEGMIKVMSGTYDRQNNQVEQLKAELNKELEITKKKMKESSAYKELQLENFRTAKALLTVQGKVRALEDELETPMSVHRWRFLESTNPEQMQLIRMNQALKCQLMDKIYKLEKFKLQKDRTQSLLETQQKHIQKKTMDEMNDAMAFFNSLLKQKTAQLNELTAQIGGRQEQVDESKENVDIVRGQLRDTREDYFGQKAMKESFKTAKAARERNETRDNERVQASTKRYIGGGFIVSSSQAQTTRPGLLLPKQIVVPQTNVRQSKVAPKGWNPGRPPLKPFLPTVSDLR